MVEVFPGLLALPASPWETSTLPLVSCLSVTCKRDSQEMEFLKDLTIRFSYCLSVTCERDSQEMEFLKDLTNRFSSFHHLTRVVAWIQRFHHNSKLCKNDRQILPVVQSSEVSKAKKTLIRLAQQSSFAGVFSLIRQGKTLPKGHSLRHHLLDINDEGLLTVTSRVRKKTDTSQPLHLILLSSKSRLTNLLLRTLQKTYGHPGISALSSILGYTYFIPGLRNLLKGISRSCANCQKAYSQTLSHQMGLLPAITDGSYLTPGHFLIGCPLQVPPNPDSPQGKMSLLRRCNLVSCLTSDLWKQWLGSYLSSLAVRAKWIQPGRPPQVGDVVFVKDETLVTRQMPVAVITDVFPVDNGQIRVVELRCKGKTYRRATERLIPLRIEEADSSSHTSSTDEHLLPPEYVQDSTPEQNT